MCDCDNSNLIQALHQQTEAISAFALTVVQLTNSVATLIDSLDIPAPEESAEPETYMDGTPV